MKSGAGSVYKYTQQGKQRQLKSTEQKKVAELEESKRTCANCTPHWKLHKAHNGPSFVFFPLSIFESAATGTFTRTAFFIYFYFIFTSKTSVLLKNNRISLKQIKINSQIYCVSKRIRWKKMLNYLWKIDFIKTHLSGTHFSGFDLCVCVSATSLENNTLCWGAWEHWAAPLSSHRNQSSDQSQSWGLDWSGRTEKRGESYSSQRLFFRASPFFSPAFLSNWSAVEVQKCIKGKWGEEWCWQRNKIRGQLRNFLVLWCFDI